MLWLLPDNELLSGRGGVTVWRVREGLDRQEKGFKLGGSLTVPMDRSKCLQCCQLRGSGF